MHMRYHFVLLHYSLHKIVWLLVNGPELFWEVCPAIRGKFYCTIYLSLYCEYCRIVPGSSVQTAVYIAAKVLKALVQESEYPFNYVRGGTPTPALTLRPYYIFFFFFLYKLLFIFWGLQQARRHFNVHVKSFGATRVLAPSDRLLYTAVVDLHLSHRSDKGLFTATRVYKLPNPQLSLMSI